MARPQIIFWAEEVHPHGIGPMPRSQHSAAFFDQYLVIFGGRNDLTFKEIQNVALNDLHLYHVITNTWTAIAMFGEFPSSRWGAKLAASENKLLLFGGMNLNNYCESVLFDIKIDNNACADYL